MTRLLIGALLLSSGCATTIRNVTAASLTEQGAYIAYWEGTCTFGCNAGDGKVRFCKLDPETNNLDCREQESLNVLLSRKAE